MATIKEAIEYAKRSPESAFATELRKRIESGQMNKELKAAGLPVPTTKPVAAESNPGVVSRVKSELSKRSEKIGETVSSINEDTPVLQTSLDIANQVVGAPLAAAYEALPQGVQDLGDKAGEAFGNTISSLTDYISDSPKLQKFVMDNPDKAKQLEDVFGLVASGSELVGNAAALTAAPASLSKTTSTASRVARNTAQNASNAVSNTVNAVTQSAPVAAARGLVSNIADRVPRAAGRLKDAAIESAEKSKRISSSTPKVAEAMKVNVPDEIIAASDNVTDAVAAKQRKEVVRIASTQKPDGVPTRPGIVGGEAAADQYKRLDAQRKAVGKQIGEEAEKLSQQGAVSISDKLAQTDDILSRNGVVRELQDNGSVKLGRGSSSFTDEQLGYMQKLYNVARETGEAMTPREIYAKTQLFSKLKREAQAAKVVDVIVDLGDGNTSNLFDVFGKGFTDKLEEVSPRIRELNRQYAPYRKLIDDLDDSIFKSGDFNISDTVDPAKIAQTSLRRIFSDAQSAATYDAIASAMDKAARELGYKGASPAELVRFATQLRKVFPESIPETSFTGIQANLPGLVDAVKSIGAPNLADQQKAIKALFGIDEVPVKNSTPTSKRTSSALPGFVRVGGQTKDVTRFVNKTNPYSKAASYLDNADRAPIDIFIDAVQNKKPISKALSQQVDNIIEAINESVGSRIINPNATDLSKIRQLSLLKDADRELTKKAVSKGLPKQNKK